MRKYCGLIVYSNKVVGLGVFSSFGCMSDNSKCYELENVIDGKFVICTPFGKMINLKDFWYSCGYVTFEGERFRVFYLEGEN